MISDSERLAQILAEDLGKGSNIDRKALAAECGISQQAISNWLKTGRIKKRYLSIVAKHTGKPLSRYLPDGSQPYPLAPQTHLHAAEPKYPLDDSRAGRAKRRILDAMEDFDVDELELLADDIERDATRQRRLRRRRHPDVSSPT